MLTQQQVVDIFNRQDIKIVESHQGMPKVLETPDGEIMKFFYAKTWPSSNNYRPYALRFYQNAKYLRQLGFLAPDVSAVHFCPDLNAHLICYKKLPGENMLSLIQNGQYEKLHQVIQFIETLHEKGVFFRAIHLSNLLYQEDGSIALIDVADMCFKKSALSLYMRYRNLKNIFLYKSDNALWQWLGAKSFIDLYNQFSSLPSIKKTILAFLLSYTFGCARIAINLVEKTAPRA